MSKHKGSTFENFLEQEELLEECEAVAIEKVNKQVSPEIGEHIMTFAE